MSSRTSRPQRVSLRSRARGSSIHSVMHRIQERDVRILFDLFEYRVLTTGQLVELHFSSYRVGSRRTMLLHHLGLLARFRPGRTQGSSPWHYALAEPGAFVVAARLDSELAHIGFRRQDPDRIAASSHLEHLVQANGFFTRLSWECRRTGRADLLEWMGERRARRGWGVPVQPDGVGTVSDGLKEVRFFLELDRGTENHQRLKGKLRWYDELARLEDVPRVLLFAFPTERREAEARRALATARLIVATATLGRAMADPLGAVWWPLRQPFRRPLLELGPGSRGDACG